MGQAGKKFVESRYGIHQTTLRLVEEYSQL
jgi:hypothetical protein